MIKKLFLFSSFLTVFFVYSQSDNNIKIRWAFYIDEPELNKVSILNLTDDVNVSSGDSIRIYLEPINNTYIYLYLLDSYKQLDLIFPQDFNDFTNNYKGIKYFIPDDENFFEVDDSSGTEEFYLIASNNRLTELEDLTRKYIKEANKSKIDQIKLTTFKMNVINEISRIRKQLSTNIAVVEKPVSTAGTTRSISKTRNKTSGNITEVEANGFYAKTLKLNH